MGNVIFKDDSYREIDDYIFEDFGNNPQRQEEINDGNVAVEEDVDNGKILQIEKAVREDILKEAEIIKKQAYDDGYKKGYEEGKNKSLEEFRGHIKRCADSILSLNSTIDDLRVEYKNLENNVADSVIALAQKIVAKQLDKDKTAIVSMTKEALGLTETNHIKIRLNSEDAVVVQKYIQDIEGGKNIEILADESLKRGSIIIEEENGSIIDAGVDAKFEQIKSKLSNE